MPEKILGKILLCIRRRCTVSYGFPYFVKVRNYRVGPVWAANCRGFISIMDGDAVAAITAFKVALPHITGLFGDTRPHLLTATVLHNLGVAAFHSKRYAQSLRYFGRFVG